MTLIKRADAINAFWEDSDIRTAEVRATLRALPSAETHEIRTETHGVCLISKDDAIDAVRKCVIQDVGDWAMLVDKAEAILAINALPAAEAEWIPCSERLPSEDAWEWYLVTVKGHESFVDVVPFDDALWKGLVSNQEIIAWMPLPKPYREENEE